ncbi:MAG: hypothetical protein Solumvirus3_6 [Solumvirus sp.]|uniref:Uncharacterized protein n=1 Tax=Solumvirus sp. TaxID=2487773 RepID=A0A3G5AGN8_9VIRU|nr:MAG: hypothetical protein Solumvirus3_6 [Solumvirus sp.]
MASIDNALTHGDNSVLKVTKVASDTDTVTKVSAQASQTVVEPPIVSNNKDEKRLNTENIGDKQQPKDLDSQKDKKDSHIIASTPTNVSKIEDIWGSKSGHLDYLNTSSRVSEAITIQSLIQISTIGIILIRTEDILSNITKVLSRTIETTPSEWSMMGLYYKNHNDPHHFVVFDYRTGDKVNMLNTIKLEELLGKAIVSKIVVLPLAEKEDGTAFKEMKETVIRLLLKEVITQWSIPSTNTILTSHGKGRLNRILHEAGLDLIVHQCKRYNIKLPNHSADELIRGKEIIDATINIPLTNQGINIRDDVVYKLLSLEGALLKFIEKDSNELQRIITLMNTYRSLLKVPPIFYPPIAIYTLNKAQDILSVKMGDSQKDSNKESQGNELIIDSSMETITLKKVIHYLNSLGNSKLDTLENFLMSELARRNNKS